MNTVPEQEYGKQMEKPFKQEDTPSDDVMIGKATTSCPPPDGCFGRGNILKRFLDESVSLIGTGYAPDTQVNAAKDAIEFVVRMSQQLCLTREELLDILGVYSPDPPQDTPPAQDYPYVDNECPYCKSSEYVIWTSVPSGYDLWCEDCDEGWTIEVPCDDDEEYGD